MEASKKSLDRIVTAAENLKHLLGMAAGGTMTESELAHYEATEEFVKKFDEAMDDDFNTADAIAAVFELVKYLNTHTGGENTKDYLEKCLERLKTLCDILGLVVEKKTELLDADIELLIEERQQARKAKNFARADEIRAELLDKGIVLEDTREGVKWKRA